MGEREHARWEAVGEDAGCVSGCNAWRLAVPGGWLYVTHFGDEEAPFLGPAYVPNPDRFVCPHCARAVQRTRVEPKRDES